jgi:hypothetical protein
VAIDVAVQRCVAKKILRFTLREIIRARSQQFRPMQGGPHFGDVHRKQPLAIHGPEKTRRKRPNRPNLEPNCAAHGGCLVRRKAREMGIVRDACEPGENVRGLAGGRAVIRTGGGCLTRRLSGLD